MMKALRKMVAKSISKLIKVLIFRLLASLKNLMRKSLNLMHQSYLMNPSKPRRDGRLSELIPRKTSGRKVSMRPEKR